MDKGNVRSRVFEGRFPCSITVGARVPRHIFYIFRLNVICTLEIAKNIAYSAIIVAIVIAITTIALDCHGFTFPASKIVNLAWKRHVLRCGIAIFTD